MNVFNSKKSIIGPALARAASGIKALRRRIRLMPGGQKIKEHVNSYFDDLDPKNGDIGLENTYN